MLTRRRFAALLGGAVLAGTGRSAVASGQGLTQPADYHEAVVGRSGGTLRVSVAADTGSLDPHALSHTNVEWIGRILFDNLVYLDEHGNATPWLARSWTISPDGTIYTFILREDVTFSDGSRFDATAVLLNLEHMRDPATKSPLAASYIAPYVSGRIVDTHVFEATLREAYSPFLNVLAQAWLAMESPKAIRERPKTLAYHPVGSGPFVLEHYTPQQGMSFARRADYRWGPPLIGHHGPAYLDRLDFEFVPDAAIRHFSLGSAEYDFTTDAPPQAAAAIAADRSLTLTSRVRMGCPSRPLTFNVAAFPFDDPKVRRAAALALDREGLALISGFGVFRPIANFLAENTPYCDARFASRLDHDRGAAERLLDEAGWTGRDAAGYRVKDGRRLGATLCFTQAYLSVALIAEIQADLKSVGFALEIEAVPLGQLVRRRNTGAYQAISGGVWHTNTPDALYINYHSSQIPTDQQGGQNASRLSDPALDALLDEARRTNDPNRLRGLYSDAQARLIELVPAVPIYDNHSVIAYRDHIRGVVYDTSHETPHFETIWLDREAA